MMRIWILVGVLLTATAAAPPARANGPRANGPHPNGPHPNGPHPNGPQEDGQGVVKLRRGDFAAGQLVDHGRGDELAWQHPDFESTFIFPFRTVTGMTFPEPAAGHRAAGDFCVELINGDRWFGSVVGVDRGHLTLRSSDQGTLAIDRDRLRRLFRWNDGQRLRYSGPGALSGWQQGSGDGQPSDEPGVWQDLGGSLRTDHMLASIYADVGLPAQAELQFALSWSGTPNFVIAIGVDQTRESLERALRLEVWDRTLVLLQESDQTAAVVALGELGEFDNHLELSIAFDQTTGHTVVHSAEGERLGELLLERETPQSAPQPLPGVRIENIAGNLQLDSLQVIAGRTGAEGISNAEQAEASSGRADGVRIQLHDGSQLHGEWVGVEGTEWILAEGDQERTVDSADIVSIAFPTAATAPAEPPAADDAGRLRVITHSGIRATGGLRKVDAGELYLQPDGVRDAVPLRVSELRMLDTVAAKSRDSAAEESASLWLEPSDGESTENRHEHESAAEQASPPSGRIGRLELAGTRLHGRLVDAEATAEVSGLRFQPLDSLESAAFRGGASGRLVYRDRHSEKPPTPTGQGAANQGILGALVDVLGAGGGGEGSPPSQLTGTSLHLRSGDVLPCEIQQIDAAGVVFESPVVGATQLPHEQIRAVALTAGSLAGIDATKRERLLTVPRMRKTTPSSHLVVSSDGDFLRGRLHSLDSQTMRFESRLETLEIPRHVVSQILWFHDEDLAETATDPPDSAAPNPSQRLRVQAVHRNGMRLSCEPRQVGGGELIGENPQLGLCLLRLAEIDQLLLGTEIEAALSDSPYHAWRLAHAPEPKAPQDGESSAMGAGGVDSPLVGTAAPEFELELLSGGNFRLSDHRGKVVVLDFWATWCGPCVQSMPQVEEAVAEFADQGVVLVAVNLQEGAEQIRSTLERLQRNPTVALDSDGLVASLYHAVAIPQTVVIDREGRVVRLFIGGGPKLGEHLRMAIEEAAEETLEGP